MSARANIIIKDRYEKLYFYRHCDGYPEEVMPSLNKFLKMVKKNQIRDNVSQSAGWLIIIGAIEYQTIPKELFLNKENFLKNSWEQKEEGELPISEFIPDDWKVGAFEPTTGIHGDIEYLYVIDLEKKEIIEVPGEDWKKWE